MNEPEMLTGADLVESKKRLAEAEATIQQLRAAEIRAALTDHLIIEPEAVYAAHRKNHLSSHALTEFRRNPRLFRKKELGLVADDDRPAFAVGRAVHCRVLEGAEELARRYAIGGPINQKTGKSYGTDTKTYAEWAAALGKPAISDDTATLCEQVAHAVHEHEEARALLAEGQAEGVVRTTYVGLPSQGRIDWLHPTRGLIDLKTCDSLEWFEMEAKSFAYAHQLAFYRALLTTVAGVTVPVYVIAVEKREPFRVGVWHFTDQVLDAASRENLAAIERLKRCRTEDRWPTGYEAVRQIDYLG